MLFGGFCKPDKKQRFGKNSPMDLKFSFMKLYKKLHGETFFFFLQLRSKVTQEYSKNLLEMLLKSQIQTLFYFLFFLKVLCDTKCTSTCTNH